nr:hypothetical protein CFP56_76061 [Quercus suber]
MLLILLFNNEKSLSDTGECLDVQTLDLLYAGIDRDEWFNSLASDENESVQAILGEGFAKILLLSENYPCIQSSLHPFLFAKLINLYFSNDRKDLQRLKQCLSVFFEHYPSLSANHKAGYSDFKFWHKYLSMMEPALVGMKPSISSSNSGAFIEKCGYLIELQKADWTILGMMDYWQRSGMDEMFVKVLCFSKDPTEIPLSLEP